MGADALNRVKEFGSEIEEMLNEIAARKICTSVRENRD